MRDKNMYAGWILVIVTRMEHDEIPRKSLHG